jgi:hypothetical protein
MDGSTNRPMHVRYTAAAMALHRLIAPLLPGQFASGPINLTVETR